jgi:capsular polysaccharide transport system permease protein
LNDAFPASLPAPLAALQQIATGYSKMSSVLLALIFKDYKGRSSKGAIALLGSLLQPLVRTIFFSTLWYLTGRTAFHGVPSFIYIAAGVFPYMMIFVALRKLPSAIASNQAMLGFPQVKPIDALLSRFTVEIMTLITAFGLFMFVLYWFFGISEHMREPLHVIGIFVMTLLMALGIGLLVGVYGHLFNGLRTALSFATLPIFFTSGALHPVTGLATEVRELLSWNPVFHVVEYTRHYWFGTRLVPEHDFEYLAMFTLGVLGFGALAYYNNRIALVQR